MHDPGVVKSDNDYLSTYTVRVERRRALASLPAALS